MCKVLYLDNHLIVVDKPRLFLTQPTQYSSESVETWIQDFLKEKFQKKGRAFGHPVHRLDRVASGIVVCARTSKALSRLNEGMRDGVWKKKYILRYEGTLPELEGTLVHYLKHGDHYCEIAPDGKRAELHYRALKDQRAEVTLCTGRYHQIRAQFAAIGCPIRGDKKYGATTTLREGGIDLHHTECAFTHPTTKILVKITSPPLF